jgi:hypothetical protein
VLNSLLISFCDRVSLLNLYYSFINHVFIIRSALSLEFSWWSCPLLEWLKTWQILMVSGLNCFPSDKHLLDVAHFYICMEQNYLWTAYVIVLAFWVIETRKAKTVHRSHFFYFFCGSMLLFLSQWFRHHAVVCAYSCNMIEIRMQL